MLQNRKQNIAYQSTSKAEYKNVSYGVSQGSIIRPLLFLIFVNDLWYLTQFLLAILFPNDINIFYSHNNVKELFRIANAELSHLNDQFSNKTFSLYTDKARYVLFHKAKSKKDNLFLVLPDLFVTDA